MPVFSSLTIKETTAELLVDTVCCSGAVIGPMTTRKCSVQRVVVERIMVPLLTVVNCHVAHRRVFRDLTEFLRGSIFPMQLRRIWIIRSRRGDALNWVRAV